MPSKPVVKHTAAFTVPYTPSAAWQATVSTAPTTLPSRPDPVGTQADGSELIQALVVAVPPQPVVVTVASRDDGVTPVAVGQTGIFCWRQLSTFCPVRDDTTLPTVKQSEPTPIPKLPSAV
jgi:hypothetical protein